MGHTSCSILINWYIPYVFVIYCKILSKVTNTLYSKSHLNHTVNIQSGLGLSRVGGEQMFLHIPKGKPQDIMWWQGLHLHYTV